MWHDMSKNSAPTSDELQLDEFVTAAVDLLS
jgi:hypothetical protein